ncbi:MAG: dethiobiotin synthase [Fibrobacter sp.]|nr:dethiobiotin synthase [Fibrobacter sp.]
MLNKKGFFITGTDTDIGKTYISKLLADTLAEKSTVTYMKPVQTGCAKDENGILRAPDFEFVMSGKSTQTSSYENHVPYRFEPACSPHLAAELSSVTISTDHICSCLTKISSDNTLTVVEGAGGAWVPLNENETMMDLMQKVGFPVILVTAPKLGTLNHTFLSLNTLKEKGIKVAGVVMNNCGNVPNDFIYDDNKKMICKFIEPLPFLEVRYGATNNSIEGFCDAIKQFI